MKAKIPIALITTRIIIGFVLIFLSFRKVEHYPVIAIIILTVGLLTDIFDGIIARKLNISSQLLRRLDSTADQIFFISVAIATYLQCTAFFKSNVIMLLVIFVVEGLTYLVSLIKFRKEIATHSIGAKIWTLFIFATLIQVMLQCESVILFHFFFWTGIITRLEIIAILLTLKTWTNDVPSIYHAVKLRQGKEIKRHKMFNG